MEIPRGGNINEYKQEKTQCSFRVLYSQIESDIDILPQNKTE